MATFMTTISFILCSLSVVLLVCAVWLVIWTRGIRRRALRRAAKQFGVSEAFAREVVANTDALRAGRIDEHEWIRRAEQIAYRYPVDSGLREALRESEGLR